MRKKLDLRQIYSLVISFRSIACVSNLQGLTALTTLKLDNNLLTEMGCLEHMVRLLLPVQQV